ncbi:MAG: protein kinase [Acidobacteriota bacterium]|nr:protein kinase [Acidobacteriota bacterium]
MSLTSGIRLGPYEILSPLGAGGMGEVWKARDTRLGRTVAIKVLSDRLARNEEVRQRFEREAETISQLSHPHICALYDVGHQDGVEYLVMEYLEGQTLADRMAKGALPLDQALEHAGQIADALDCAHRRGVVHRDLKPGNVMLTRSGVKLLDFGLAKALAPPAPADSLTAVPTVAKDLTREGTILGTVAYMAPEQLEGQEADERTDLFALGAVLYEMTTGRKAFAGATHASLVSAIMKDEPAPLSSLQPTAPPSLDRLVRTCLAKEPERRWRSAHDVGLQLAAIAEGSSDVSAAAAPRAGFWKWAAVAGVIAVGLALGLRARRAAGPTAPTIRFPLAPPAGGRFVENSSATLALSPDGTRVAFVLQETGRAPRLWQRMLSDLETRPIDGTDGASSLFWSADGRSIAFFAGEALKRVDASGGAPVPIADVGPLIAPSGSWGAAGQIVFASAIGDAIYRVSAEGGRPEAVVRADAPRGETRLAWPWFLPDGKRFLYLSWRRYTEGELRLFEAGRAARGIAPLRSKAQYVDPGYLVFAREGALLGQRFDPDAGRLTGAPFSIAPAVSYFLSNGWAGFAASRNGTIAYRSRENVDRLVWFDRAGRSLGDVGSSGDYLDVSISPDARRVLFSRRRRGIGTWDIWQLDLERGVETAVTSELGSEFGGAWLPDGKSIVYSAAREARPQLFRRDLATGQETALLPVRGFQEAGDVSPDGRTLVFSEHTLGGAFELFTLSLSGGSPPQRVPQAGRDTEIARFSPDGRALAVLSEESGRREAYVAPFGSPGERIRVSAEGAANLRWSRDGKEIVYLDADGRLFAAPIRTTPSLEVGRAVTLFRFPQGKTCKDFDLAPDGRFLAIVEEESGNAQPLTVAVNWTAEVRKN